jgi:hypothetical protein
VSTKRGMFGHYCGERKEENATDASDSSSDVYSVIMVC